MNVLESQHIKEWMSELRTESTANSYALHVQRFFEWYETTYAKTIDDYVKLETKEMRHLILVYQNWLQKQKVPDRYQRKNMNGQKEERFLSANSVRSAVVTLKAFAIYLDKPLNLKGKILKMEIDTGSHVFKNGDLRQMFAVGNAFDKALLSTMCSLGWEIEGVLELKRSVIERLISNAKAEGQRFVFFDAMRGKTKVSRLGILNPLALEWLEKWLKTEQKKKTDRVFPITLEGTNKFLRRLARESKILTSGRIHSHLIRKWVMSGLSRAGFNEWETKFTVGKAIPLSDSTYLTSLKDAIMEKYPKIYDEYMNINPPIIKTEVKTEDFQKLIETVTDLKEENRWQKNAIEALLKQIPTDNMPDKQKEQIENYLKMSKTPKRE